jgi:hypothetical protein
MFEWLLNISRLKKSIGHLFLTALTIFSTTSALVFYQLSETSLVTSKTTLNDYWRTTYDLLVRPPDSKAAIEKEYNLVEANYLNSINGGITFTQYETIRNIPGVEVAAPVANLGKLYFHVLLETIGIDQYVKLRPPEEQGVYALVSEIQVDEGFRTEINNYRIYAIVNLNPETDHGYYLDQRIYVGRTVSPYPPFINLPFAAIDPEQEAKLVNLDKSLIEGEYFDNKNSWSAHVETSSMFGNQTIFQGIPVLINETPYVFFSVSRKLEKVNMPGGIKTIAEIQALGGQNYLDTLPSDIITTDGPYKSQELYKSLISQIKSNLAREPFPGTVLSNLTKFTYQNESSLPGSPDIPVFKSDQLHLPKSENILDNPIAFSIQAVGVFNLENIPKPKEINRVPLETYYPPTGVLLYDESMNPVSPRLVLPSIVSSSRFISPPLLLTTLNAARVVAGENCISSIRIRVAGIDGLTPEAQQKIESIATAIVDQTGLAVDIMVGSSPRPVLVHIPDVGYVEEQWIQKGVSTEYASGLTTANQIMLWVFGLISFLTIFEYNWMTAYNRRREFALTKALGWRTKDILLHELGNSALIGLLSSAAACGISLGLAPVFHLQISSLGIFGWTILIVTGISILGGCAPAWIAGEANPIEVFKDRADPKTVRIVPSNSIFRIALNSLVRSPLLTLLNLAGIALSNALLCYILFALNSQRGYLSGTLLGQYLLVHLESSHIMLTVVGFLLSITAIAIYISSRVRLDIREIRITESIGWRDRDVRNLYLWQSSITGFTGGLFGLLLAILFYRLITGGLYLFSGFGWAILLAGLVLPWLASFITSFTAVKRSMR